MIPQSSEVRFEVTTKCNYHCVMCPRDELVRKKETMAFEEFKFYLDKIRSETNQYDTVTFSGFGEALLDPTLIDKMAYARKFNYKVLLLTTGSLLTVEKFKKMDELGVESVRFSLHGNSVEAYTKTHQTSEKFFHKVTNLVRDISRLKRKTKIILTYVETEYNRGDVESWILEWKDKVDLIEAWRPHNWVDGRSYRDTQEIKQVKTCGRPEKGPLQIQVDGTINMCCFDFNGQLLLGDLKTQSLKEIFEDGPFQKIFAYHKTGDFKGSHLICENCDQRNGDKSAIMIYNSRFNISERVQQVSTTYLKLS